ncbi:MAG: hypothetical protein A3J46_01565 [Candidatus Yanofskybacteria bacterium RIFCSPHIGHO2_02_FULL_41_11]|uniref:dolichyl-phosphate beta-glucosyltransferase n=1 Tax=Candidatus Yanofskybacteria bacterium RIFCSPHIGHO2_02_FULL_41_11 TaxID=1802675 RepID=A0A1F8F8Z3_9BACT|nr:MAG: hypothetical protein A3J46_01565 [Candidatus Yanofskybacteria bacterium RIFCSPHIGHO2_02_FULL_41_11]
MYLSVIIPAYNEERNIEKTVRAIFDYLEEKKIEHEIIVVTDGSLDKTDNIVQLLRTEISTLKLINYKSNRGKGFAVKTGMLEARGDLRLFTDADNSTSIDHLDKFISHINQGYSVVIGSIAVLGHKVAAGSEPLWRRVFGKLGNLFIQIMAVPGIHDTQRGFKLFTAEAAGKIFPKLTIERWGFDIEVLALARKLSFKTKEVPVDWKNASESRVSFKSYFQVLIETVKIRWNLITGRYNQPPTTNHQQQKKL